MRTRMTELLGIEHPIMLAGMNWATEPILVSAVSNAGGLGVLALSRYTPEEARTAIREVKRSTDKPFGINVGLMAPRAAELIGVAIEERSPVLNYSLGKPWFVEQVHQYGGKVVGTVTTVKNAVRAEQLGVDAICVPTYEAAAHGSDTTALILIPLVARQTRVPLVAAGGFYEGRGLAAALLLGADGIAMGQRFLVTKESQVHDNCKKMYLDANEDDIVSSDIFDGLPGKVLRTKVSIGLIQRSRSPMIETLTNLMVVKRQLQLSWWQLQKTAVKALRSQGRGALLQLIHQANNAPRIEKAIFNGDMEEGVVYGGPGVAGIRDIPSCQELIDRVVREAGILVCRDDFRDSREFA